MDPASDRYRLVSSEMRRHLHTDTRMAGVMLVVGGDLNTLRNVHQALTHKRPVIALVDSGGAAEHLFRAWQTVEASRSLLPASQLSKLLFADQAFIEQASRVRDDRFPSVAAYVAAYVTQLLECVAAVGHHGRHHKMQEALGKRQEAARSGQLSFFNGQRQSLESIVENALLASSASAERADLSVGMKLLCKLMPRNSSHDPVSSYEYHLNERLVVLRGRLRTEAANEGEAGGLLASLVREGSGAGTHTERKMKKRCGSCAAQVFCAGVAQMPEFSPGGISTSGSSTGRYSGSVGSSPSAIKLPAGARLAPSVLHQLEGFMGSGAMSVRVVSNGLYSLGSHRIDLRPEWRDLMMWAVLMGCQPLARLLWEQTAEPTRTAVMASRVCHRLVASRVHDRFDEELGEQAEAFENLAIGILDSIGEPNEAKRLLEQVPSCADYAERKRGRAHKLMGGSKAGGKAARPIYLWQRSVLDEASQGDPCLKFVAHKHCQYAVCACHIALPIERVRLRAHGAPSACSPSALPTMERLTLS